MAADNGIATSATFVGVAMGKADGSSSETYNQKVAVCIDPMAIYRVQSNSSTLPIQSEMWEAYGTTVPATYTGSGELSDMELTGDNSASGTLGQWILIGIVTGPQQGGGVLPTWAAANVELYVKPNPTQMLPWAI